MSSSTGDILKATILIFALAGSIFLTISLRYSPPPPKQFSFQEAASPMMYEIDVSNIDGQVIAGTWNKPMIQFNGTIIASGEGASPGDVHMVEQNFVQTLSFEAAYPQDTPGRSYSVNANLYLPSTANFSYITIGAVGNGSAELDSLNATNISVSTQAGDIDMTLKPIISGDYSIHAFDGGSVNLKVPETSSFKLTADSGYSGGQVTVNGFNSCMVNTSSSFNPMINKATVSCGGQSANIVVQTDHRGLNWANITITSI